MKEIKITFGDKDINVQAKGMSGREFLTALGTAFLAGCENFNVEPLSAIEILMNAEDAVEDDEDEGDEDDYDCCIFCGQNYAYCYCGLY